MSIAHDMYSFLESSIYIDWKHPRVSHKAARLAEGGLTDEEVTRKCFQFVRDEIKHSWDYQLGPVTCKASDVLAASTGFCYAKSHLLAALLRANGIPAGLCYQRLLVAGDRPPYCLHGLNAVYLKQYGWYRMDARGNRSDVLAEFTPPTEKLAFATKDIGERDFDEIHAEPLAPVVAALTWNQTIAQVYYHLPDAEAL